ncbi:MAG: hypothetical protein ACKV0T_11775, partial [Planctomycetales bacterium]
RKWFVNFRYYLRNSQFEKSEDFLHRLFIRSEVGELHRLGAKKLLIQWAQNLVPLIRIYGIEQVKQVR